MKLYRVVPNTFSTGKRLDADMISGAEDIYYKMGYASFLGKRGFHKYNSLFEKNDTVGDGKYFFLFPEDAIRQGYYLLTRFHKLPEIESFYVVEYDFPIDIAFQYFGYGDYTFDDGLPNPLMEVFVEKKNFSINTQDIITPNNIPEQTVNEVLLNSLTEVLESAMTDNNSEYDRYRYEEYARKNYYRNLEDFISDPKNIEHELKRSRMLWTFHSLKGELIKSPYLTGKIILINLRSIFSTYSSWKDASEYFQSMNIRYDLSKEQKAFKTEILEATGYCNPNKKNSQLVKKLLQERNYL